MRVHWARNQAEQLVEQLLQRGRVTGPPIDPVRVAKFLDLPVVADDLGPDISGLLIRRGDRAVIAVQRLDPPNRRNFTVAHEIAHHVLGHQFEQGGHVHVDKGNFISKRGPRSSTGLDPKEVEANQFAAALLMPSQMVRAAAAELGQPLWDSAVSDLAGRFRVSDQAMTIRLQALGLL